MSSLTNQSDVIYIVADRLSAQSQTNIRVHNQDGYRVVVYDRGEDHIPEIWPAGMEIIPLVISDRNSSLGTIKFIILYITFTYAD